MVVLNKIYTKTGDSGTTGLVTGERISKTNQRIQAVGTVDELNSFVGLARVFANDVLSYKLFAVQHDLFDLGADLANPDLEMEGALRIVPEQTERLEREIDEMNKEAAPLTSFVLPGGSPLVAHLHVCRSTARRAEREVLALLDHANPEAAKYLNRLSDWFFVLCRANGPDILWKPGNGRA